jgi:hypothetical protein
LAGALPLVFRLGGNSGRRSGLQNKPSVPLLMRVIFLVARNTSRFHAKPLRAATTAPSSSNIEICEKSQLAHKFQQTQFRHLRQPSWIGHNSQSQKSNNSPQICQLTRLIHKHKLRISGTATGTEKKRESAWAMRAGRGHGVAFHEAEGDADYLSINED